MPRTALLAAAVVAGLAASAFGIAAASANPNEARLARPLTSNEVYQIYANRSWIWKEGAGFFAVKKREFSAWSHEGGAPSYGVGRWFITSPGKLCFRAEWRAMDGSAPAVTCFSHREKDGVIYQKREPDGEWYVFRQMPARMSDEYAKLRRGDYVVTRMRRIEARLGNR
ncbi:DUF995 domain-containing protein [Chelativorans alearense]|uniref:DUF995 domain-containing protein n=1 Tax=Chelativorans alearense TaxID=2681495 RepID=UPI0013D4B381|nr:DUF995 domain-containing protein [Chelativorans alearense]